MIEEVVVEHFKRFGRETFDVRGEVTLLAGPNNSGKSTLLQALATWNLALRRWFAERGNAITVKRISLTAEEFTALPIREMNLLWENRKTAVPKIARQDKTTSAQVPVLITVKGRNDSTLDPWQLSVEYLYASQKLIYARPLPLEATSNLKVIPEDALSLNVVHIPPFSGLETEEPYRDKGYQNRLIGQGRPGEIVRNLLWSLWNRENKDDWNSLAKNIQQLFGYDLLPPEYNESSKAFILCEYKQSLDRDKRLPRLDIANAGSGFHQTLLLLSFFYARPASLLLLDEPDAHLHFILQRELFNHLRNIATQRRCQLIVATHSEALLDSSEPEEIVSLFDKPHRLKTRSQVRAVQDALHRLHSTDLLKADHVGSVLYVEDESDARILQAWADQLKHRSNGFFRFPYFFFMGGKGALGEVKRHFLALRAAYPKIRGVCLLDRDSDSGPPSEDFPPGLDLVRWKRYEIENYLVHPEVLRRFVAGPKGADQPGLELEGALEREGLGRIDPMSSDIRILIDIKGSDLLVDLLRRTSRPTAKKDLYKIAQIMSVNEIHADVTLVLEQIGKLIE